MDHQRFHDSAEAPRKRRGSGVDGQFPHVFYTIQASFIQFFPVFVLSSEPYMGHSRTDMERGESEMNKTCVGTVSDISKAPASRKLAGGRGAVLFIKLQAESTKSKQKTHGLRLEQSNLSVCSLDSPCPTTQIVICPPAVAWQDSWAQERTSCKPGYPSYAESFTLKKRKFEKDTRCKDA